MLKVLRATLRLKRAGAFDTKSYRAFNSDLSSVWFPTVHFVRHGFAEERRYRGSHLDHWSAGQLVSGDVSAKLVRSLRKIEKSEGFFALTEAMHSAGIDPRSIKLAHAIGVADTKLIATIMSQSSGREYFDFAFEIALKRMDLTYAEEALNWGIAFMSEANSVSINFLDRLRSFAEVLDFGNWNKHQFHIAALQAWVRDKPYGYQLTLGDLQLLGLPVAAEDDHTKELAANSITSISGCSIASDTFNDSGLSITQARLLNTATLNALSAQKYSLAPRRNWSVEKGVLSANCVSARLPRAHFWRDPGSSAFHLGVVQATELMATTVAGVMDSNVEPTHSGRLHILDKVNPNAKITISYHSVSQTGNAFVHFKETSLPGWYSIDRNGFSGWSYLSEQRIKPHPSFLDNDLVASVKSEIKKSRATKYAQGTGIGNISTGGVLFPLQIASDSVMSLASLRRSEVARALCEITSRLNVPLTIKAHPLDLSRETHLWLERLSAEYENLHISDAHIHDLISASSCVVVANSGVGLEALLLEKPVVTFAPSEYALATVRVESLGQLEKAVRGITTEGVSAVAQKTVDDVLSSFFSCGAFRLNDEPAVFETKFKQAAGLLSES